MSEWINVKDRLPEKREKDYQVMVCCKKQHGGNYAGQPIRRFMQDWNVRKYPDNFTAWMYDPLPEPPKEES